MKPAHRSRKPQAVVIGASSGGVHALKILLQGLPADFQPAVIVVLHSAARDHQNLAQHYATVCALPVSEAVERTAVLPGHVYLAPPGYHLLVEHGPRFALSVDPKVCHVRPAADVLFHSAADVWRDALVGVILTGANEDGAQGAVDIRSRGGCVVIQDPASAEFAVMPQSALRLAGADHVVSLEQMAALLNQLCGEN